MKQIFGQYATSIIALIVASALFTIFFNENVHGKYHVGTVLGTMMKHSLAQTPFSSREAFDDYMESKAPEIYMKENIIFYTNQKMNLAQCFYAWNAQGNEIPVFLKNIKNEYGEFEQIEFADFLYFHQTGIYWIEVYAIDENQKETSVIAKIYVNEGKNEIR